MALHEDMDKFCKGKGKMANPVVKRILDALKEAQKVPDKHSGKVVLTLCLSQGGIEDAELAVMEKMK